jgi:hypothetical protein
MLYHKFCIITIILLILFLYIYVKKEKFENQTTTIPITTNAQLAISVQLTNEIARVLEISPMRIYNLVYEGDITLNTLRINFNILDTNLMENLKNEKTQFEAEQQALALVNSDSFFVKINNQSIIIRKMQATADSAFFDKGMYFNNEGLKLVSKYVKKSYDSVPNDESLTKFYTLGFDKDYNLTPKI